jgi:multicomponent K+:H+ antiporter subunit D
MNGGGAARSRAGLHYVILNLSGSALFLLAVGVLYGMTGTLNMADLARAVAAAPPTDAPLLRTAALLLLVAFGLKAALLPLHFWLPLTYTAAGAGVAALFAIMTKVGVYAIVRVFTLIFGNEAGAVAGIAQPWLLPAALATLAVGSLGAVASRGLRELAAYLTLASVGTLLVGVGLFSHGGITAALFYLIHSTLTTATLFLLSDVIGTQRGPGVPERWRSCNWSESAHRSLNKSQARPIGQSAKCVCRILQASMTAWRSC